MGLDPGAVLRKVGLSTEINGTDGSTRSLASVVDRDTQPNQYSRSDNYLPEREVGHPPGLFSHGLLSHQILFLRELGSLIVLVSGIGAILRAASLGDCFPVALGGWTLPADTRGWWNGFRAALLGMEYGWQQDCNGCNQSSSNKSV
jgi:hypothetical protein